MSTTAHARTPARRRARWVGWTLLVVAVAVLVALGLLVRDALTARDALTQAMQEVPAAEEALRAGDTEAATAALASVQDHTATARDSTDGFLWTAAAHLPLFGADVHAVAVSAATADNLASGVLPELADVAGVANGDALTLGPDGVDLAPLVAAAPGMARAATTFDEIDARLATVDPDALHAEVVGPFEQLVATTDTLRPTVRTADRLTTLGPAMLGEQGPRRYLVLAQNNAELRATGGIAGALALVTVDDGVVALDRQASPDDVPPLDEPVLPLDPGVEQLYTDRVGRFIQDTTLTPDFPTAAALSAAMWEGAQGETVDGVVGIDPVALSYLLEATGPVEVDGQSIDSTNVVQTLLSDAYVQYGGGEASDAFFAAVSTQVLQSFLDGGADLGIATGALSHAADEHRLLLWSAHEEEQAELAGTVVAGDIDTAERARDTVGVFFNDGTGAKMSYYLDTAVRHTGSGCSATGRRDTFAVDLASTAPDDAATSLPAYVTGDGYAGVEPGVTRTFVVLYPPRGGALTDVRVDDAPAPGQPGTVADRPAVSVLQDLDPGASATLTFTTVTPTHETLPVGAPADRIDVWSTPTVTAGGLQTVDVATCG
ncbi:DUF4012 domain-containing protein [Cellulosimicrobium terreum]|nr:DUF4012 domain-containing protein [Cellulosimicrobium terreum]